MFCGCCNRFAFTLAEVLITLGVIGVVAGMTLPNLIHKAQDRATISQLKKAYSVLNQAFRRAVDEYGPVDSWCDADNYRSGGDRAECTEMIPKILSQYISMQNSRVQVTYKNRVKGGTFSMGSNFKNNTTFVLNDGTILYFYISPGDNYSSNWCKESKDVVGARRFYYHCGQVFVDVTGKSKPNVNNKDFFAFQIYQDGIAPMGNRADEKSSYYYTFNSACKSEVGAYGACTGWVLDIGNMDYQYCNDLSYTGKTQCH